MRIMKYLVVSDSHGDRDVLSQLVKQYRHQVDYFFHCGDSELDENDRLWDIMIGIKGNCDLANIVEERSFNTGDDNLYVVHGDELVGDGDLLTLALNAESNGANIALYGHTHVPYVEYDKERDILLVNPGSISLPRQQSGEATYAIIESSPEQYQVTFYGRDNEALGTKTIERA